MDMVKVSINPINVNIFVFGIFFDMLKDFLPDFFV